MDIPITVVIPTAGRSGLIERTLRSLAECERPETYQRTLVVENGPTREAKQIVEAHRDALRLEYLHTTQANKSHALNLALEHVREGLLVLFDDDVRLDAGVLKAYARAASNWGKGHFFGGPLGVDYEEPPPEWLRRHLPPSAVGWELYSEESDRFMGPNWAAFAEDLKHVGGFSTELGPGTAAVGQEHQMQARLVAAGIRGRYVADARAWHWVPRERCTPEWAIERVGRMAHRNVILQRQNGQGSRLSDMGAGAKWAGYWAVYRVRQALSLDPVERFETRYYREMCKGHLRGLLQRRR